MPYNNAAKNTMLDALATEVSHVSAHTADPGGSGANEVSGGNYAREAVAWNAASGGEVAASNQPVLTIPGGNTVTHIGFWTALTGGSFRGSRAIDNEAFGAEGTMTLDAITMDLNN